MVRSERGKTIRMLLLVIAGLSPSGAFAQFPGADWVRVSERAGWQARDSQAEVVYKGRMWIMGGWFSSQQPAPRDVWSSSDGKNWEQVTAQAPWIHSDLSMSIVFQDRMWMMGGWYNGRLPDHASGNQVWSSADGKDWKEETPAAAWSPRVAAGLVKFKEKLWILGGTENYYYGNSSSLKNDVWSSSDGKNWTLETPHAGWSPRAYHQAAVLNGRIYVMGGGNYVPEYQALHDVWSSADGVNWRQETAAAPWHARLWFSTVVYREHLWVLGGWSHHPYQNWNDVWYSKDGRDWQELKTAHIWPVRHEHSTFVFQDRLWVTGGLTPPLNNDVWMLELPNGNPDRN